MADIITNRLQEVKDSMPDNLRQSFDKLNDFEKMDMTDSRYQQWLSDKVEKTKDFMSQLDSEVKKAKDSEDMINLRKQIWLCVISSSVLVLLMFLMFLM